MKKNKIALLLAVVVMWTNSFTCLAATKTAAGLENNTPSGTSDAQAFVEGIKKYDSAYSKTYKDPSSVTASDFWSKSHTIKYWSSHGSNNGTVWGANSSVSVNIFDQPFSWAGGEPIKLLPQNGIASAVLRDGYNLSMIGTEIGDKKVNMTE